MRCTTTCIHTSATTLFTADDTYLRRSLPAVADIASVHELAVPHIVTKIGDIRVFLSAWGDSFPTWAASEQAVEALRLGKTADDSTTRG